VYGYLPQLLERFKFYERKLAYLVSTSRFLFLVGTALAERARSNPKPRVAFMMFPTLERKTWRAETKTRERGELRG
jgi:hypothetical protein